MRCVKYQAGEDLRVGDWVSCHGESGHIEFLAFELGGEYDWYFKEFPGGGGGIIAVHCGLLPRWYV